MADDLPESGDQPPPLPTPPPPPPAAPPPPVVKRERGRVLGYRSDRDRYVAGVAGGQAERFGIDPLFPRLALVALTLLWRDDGAFVVVLVAYLLAWLAVPARERSSVLRRLFTVDGGREALGAVVLFVVAIVAVAVPGLWVALALGAIAWALLTDRRAPFTAAVSGAGPGPGFSPDPASSGENPRPTSGGGTAEQSTAATSTAAGFGAQGSAGEGEGGGGGERGTALRWGRTWRRDVGPVGPDSDELEARRARREPALWPVTLGLLGLLAIFAITVDNVLEPGLKPGVVVDLALIIIGSVVLLSAWKGRAAGTAMLVVPLIVPWIAFSVSDVDRWGPAVDATPTELPAEGVLDYRHGYGNSTIDLSALPLAPGDQVVVNTGVTAGSIDVLVPSDAEVVVNYHMGLGVRLLRGDGGFGVPSLIDIFDDGAPHLRSAWIHNESLVVNRSGALRLNALGPICGETARPWSTMVEAYRRAGVDLDPGAGDVAIEAERDEILDAIEASGMARPTFLDPFDDPGDEHAFWGFMIDLDGKACVPTEAPANPARIVINSTTGFGHLEVRRVLTN